jgi:hypothetical protein
VDVSETNSIFKYQKFWNRFLKKYFIVRNCFDYTNLLFK